MKKLSTLLLLLFAFFITTKAQFVISYPNAAQSFSAGLDNGTLNIRVDVLTAGTNGKVTVNFPVGISYVQGSIVVLSGSVGVSEQNITNLNAPVFSLNNSGSIGVGEYVSFTIKRRSTSCSVYSYVLGGGVMKDAVTVSSTAGTKSENNSTVNTYNLYYPSLSITPAAAITGANFGSTYTRTSIVSNGGTGCLDTLRFYIVYTNTGTQLVGNQITVNGSNFSPVSSNGDTLFFKIAGATVFGDNLLCNGESVSIVEHVKVLKCGSSTSYAAGWDHSSWSFCQVATGSTNIIMDNGTANIASTWTAVQALNWCQTGIYTVTYTNNGTGGLAGAAYSILANLGFNTCCTTNPPAGISTGMQGRVDSVKIGNITVPFVAATATLSGYANFAALTSDPDGANIGMDDLDGDGQFDDLAIGKTVTITVYMHHINNNSCPMPAYGYFSAHTLSYTNMCGTASFTTNPLPSGINARIQYITPSVTVPAQIIADSVFTVQYCVDLGSVGNFGYIPKDSLYLDLTVPQGMALSATPNVQYNFNAIATQAGSYSTINNGDGTTTIRIQRKGKVSQFCFKADFTYNCSAGTGGGYKKIAFKNYYAGDYCATAVENYACLTDSVFVLCSAPCTDGVKNFMPVVSRTSLGWTDTTVTTKVNPSVVTGLAKITGLPLDTFQIIIPGKQMATAGSYGNLYYDLKLGKASGNNIFSFVSGTFNQIHAGATYTSSLSDPVTTASTSSVQDMLWNLTNNLYNKTVYDGDSVWLDFKVSVTTANSGQLYGTILTRVPNTRSLLYNLTASNTRAACDTPHMINMFLSGISVGGIYSPVVYTQPGSYVVSSSNLYLGSYNGFDLFPNEFRPQTMMDSVVVTLPTGYTISTSAANLPYYYYYFTNPSTITAAPLNNRAPIVNKSGNTWIARNPNPAKVGGTGWGEADYARRASPCYLYRYSITPTCAATSGTFNQTQTWYFRDFAYTGNSGNYVNKTVTVTTQIVNNALAAPSIAVQNNTGIVQGINAQHYWDVQINNTSAVNTPYLWMSLEKPAGSAISVDSVVLKPSNVKLTANTFNSSDTWYQVSTAGLTGGANQQARVYFHFTNCGLDSIRMKAGWDFTAYPSPDPNSYSCTTVQQYLKVLPQVSEVQLSLVTQPASAITSCTPASYSLLLNSAQAANLINPRFEMILPTGLNISSPLQAEYPANSGNWATITNTGTAAHPVYLLSSHPNYPGTGIPGLGTTSAVNPRNIAVQFSVQNDCSFTIGSQIVFKAFANQPCATAAVGNGIAVASNAVYVAGINTPYYTVNTSVAPINITNCNTVSTASFSSITVAGITGSSDSIYITLPVGIAYQSGSFASSSSSTPTYVTTAYNNDGTSVVVLKVPAGAASGTRFDYSIGLVSNGQGNCGTNLPIVADFKSFVPGPTCGATSCASIATLTGSTSTQISIVKPTIVIGNGISACFNKYVNTVNLSAAIKVTNGNIATGSSVKVYYYCSDAIGNPAGSALDSSIISGPVAQGDSALFTATINGASCTLANGLVVKAGLFDCVCSADLKYTPVNVCSGGSIGNSVWIDSNSNGLMDENTGIDGMTVYLYRTSNSNLVDSTVTASNGTYSFTNLSSGNYYVKFPTSYQGRPLTTANQTTNTDNNSDADKATGYSEMVTINAAGTGVAKDNNTIDAGYAMYSDIQVTKTVNQTNVTQYDNVTFRIIVKNNGPENADNVVLNDILPSSLNFISSTANTGFYWASVWSLGTIAPGVSDTLNIVAQVTSTGSINNTAYVNHLANDSSIANDTSAVVVNATAYCTGFSAGTDQIVCAGTATNLTGLVLLNGSWTALNTNPAGSTVGSTNAGVASVTFSNTATGTYQYIYANAHCTDTMLVTIKPVSSSATNTAICANALPYSWNGNSYNAAGTYTVHLTNSVGCDSAATLNLTVLSASTSLTNVSVCQNSLPYSWNGNSYNAAGTYTVHLTNSVGCDSAATINLTVLASTVSTTDTTICNASLPLTWNGNNYNAAGTYIVHLTNAVGCDSAATLNLHLYAMLNTPITGSSSVCLDTTLALTNATPGGNWYSSDTAIITVDTAGLVSTVSVGSATIIYKLTVNSCADSVSKNITVLDCGGEVSGGITGGLESKGLGEVIGKRVMNKIWNSESSATNYARLTPVKSFNVLGVMGSTMSLADVFPGKMAVQKVLNNTVNVYDRTPQDVTGFSNATDVYAQDYSISNVCRAVTFATKTSSIIYNHTKPVCDRLREAVLMDVKTVEVNGTRLVMYKLLQREGYVEYAISLSAGINNGENLFQIQSTWLNENYSGFDNMYNFQIWASSAAVAKSMAADLLNNLGNYHPYMQLLTPTIPAVYIASHIRNGKQLQLVINNSGAATSTTVQLTSYANELSKASPYKLIPVSLAPFAQTVVDVDVADNYQQDVKLYDGNFAEQDMVYSNDGTWDINYNATNTTISKYVVTNDTLSTKNDEWRMFRNVTVNGSSKDYITVYKLMKAAGLPRDLSEYKGIKFTAALSGISSIKITLVKNSITDWNKQYSATIPVQNNTADYTISLNQFVSSLGGSIDMSDVTAIDFSYIIGTGATTAYSTTLSNVRFTKYDGVYVNNLTSKALTVYPNPVTSNKFTCIVHSDKDKQVMLRMYEVGTGRLIYNQPVAVTVGENVIPVIFNESIKIQKYYVVSIEGYSNKMILVKQQ